MIRVAVVDDHALVRQGILGLLALSDDIAVAGEAALALLDTVDVDVMLLDLIMPGRDGIATLHALHDRDDAPATLVLTTFDDTELLLGAMRAGARGYLLKDVTLDSLLAAIRTLAGGGTFLQPALTERLLRAVQTNQPRIYGVEQPPPLTRRELEVVRLATAGLTNTEIADALFLAVGTVKNHMSNVLVKLGVRDRTQAVLRALELGLMQTHADGPEQTHHRR
ncbi:MAG: response regulator [Acidimicrobiia bacterium]|nr:response regulator [Acidimicrobiia bacterium]